MQPTAGGSGKSSSFLSLPRKRKMLNKQPWKHTPLFTEAQPLLFLHWVICTATDVSVALSLQETPSLTLSCTWSPSPKGTAEQRLPLPVLCAFVWLLTIGVVFPTAHQWNLLSKSLYVHPLNEGLIYHFICCFFPRVLRFSTFLLKIILRDVFKIISTNAFVPYMENVVKQSKVPWVFLEPWWRKSPRDAFGFGSTVKPRSH